ncbi:MAG: branched-chain amino acid ABC transporter permease [Nocardioidaceae bacterium]
MRRGLLAVLAVCFLALLTAPGAYAASVTDQQVHASALRAANGDESVNGTLRGPSGKPVPKVSIEVLQDGKKVGKDTTDAKGEWEVPLPKPGTYTVTLDLSTLPKKFQPRDQGGEVLEDVAISPGQDRTVIFPLIKSGAQQQDQESPGSSNEPTTSTEGSNAPGPEGGGGESFMSRFLQLIVEGIKLGAIIAITAVGLSLVFGTTSLINFAHGELVTLGAMAAFFFNVNPLQLPLVIAALLAVLVGGAAGAAIEGGLWRPMRRRGAGRIQMFIISIGLSLLLRHVLLVLFGSRRKQYGQYTLQQTMDWGPFSITPRDLIITVLSIVVLLVVALLLQRTRIGKATRAVSDNKDLAEASGIDVNRVILIVWIFAGGLAALGGVLYGLSEAIYWDMGFNLLLLMFAGVILGGLGSAYGAIVGSLVVGLVAQLSTLWFPPELQNAWALLALIVVLLVRPQGILGRAERAG